MKSMLHFHHANVDEAPKATPGDAAKALAKDLARHVAQWLQTALDERGQALLIVSGGSTPVPFFDALADTPLDTPHDWAKVTITLADERWVEPTHADSNERLVRDKLLQRHAARARFVPMYNGAATPAEGLQDLNEAMKALPWPAAVTVLGMGGDGHTASLFPSGSLQASEWADGARGGRCIAIGAPARPNVPVPRVSLTPHALRDAAQLVVHVTGQDKAAVLRKAMQDGPAFELPVRLALHQHQVPCHVFQAP